MLEDKEKEQKKDEEKSQEKEKKELGDIEINSPEELQELLDNLAGSGKNPDKKVKKIALVNRLFPNIFINLLFYIMLFILITLAFQGYLGVFSYEAFYELLIFATLFSVADTLIKDLLYSKIPFVVITSFGIVLLLTTVASCLGALWITPNLYIKSNSYFILYVAVVLIVRTILTQYLTRVRLSYLHKRRRKNKK